MSTPKVSVIIPVYNAQRYLQECLNSILNQTLQDIEVLCVDDGSTDDSPAILTEFAQKDARIRVIHQENRGAGAARNNGLQYASGEYLSIIDCDDFFEPAMLEKSYQAARENNVDMIVFGCDFFHNENQQYSPCTYSINTSLLPSKNVFSAFDVKQDVFKLFVGWSWDKLFRTDFVRQNNLSFQQQRTTNDLLFVFSGLLRASRITVLHDTLAHHRCGVESLSATREKSWMCFHNALLALREQMQKIGCYERFEQDFKNYYVHFSLWNLETLTEPAHTLLYHKLREEWFEEMGLLQHPKAYYYNKNEYASFMRVYKHPPDWIFMGFSRGIQCCREHGCVYTLKRITNKLRMHKEGKK